MSKLKGDRIWVVTINNKLNKTQRKVYYNEEKFLMGMSSNQDNLDITVQIYDITMVLDGKNVDIHSGILKSNVREKRLSVLLDGVEDTDTPILRNIKIFIENMEKYSPKNIFLSRFKKNMNDIKATIRMIKERKIFILYHVSSDIEWYESVLRVHPFKSIDEEYTSKEYIDNFNQAKININEK